jgi:hypothetical protein
MSFCQMSLLFNLALIVIKQRSLVVLEKVISPLVFVHSSSQNGLPLWFGVFSVGESLGH